MRKIPATMVSQHPDHAGKPYWLHKSFISTRHEPEECLLSFRDLGVSEYKWDWEGKYVDESVVERLLSEHLAYFKKNQLGRDKFLTFRLPNPKVETEFRMSRAFMVILGAAALAKKVGFSTPPLFEVILPMAESAEEMISVQEAFHELTNLKHPLHKLDKDLKHIEIIPLFEQVQTIIHSNQILRDYLTLHKLTFGTTPRYIRPYMARSDPALNSGIIPTILAIKIALSRYRRFEEEENVKLYPIIGSASLPFRGGLTPYTVDAFIDEYKGVQTALLQSAFRYDYKKEDVIAAIARIERELPTKSARQIPKNDELELRRLIPIFEMYYRRAVEGLAEIINTVASQLPKRRERVQHIGLFGYSRGVGRVRLPRAIGFTAAMYSLGCPPEFMGTGRGLMEISKLKKRAIFDKYYLNIRSDMLRAGGYVHKEVLRKRAIDSPIWESLLEDIAGVESYLGVSLGPKTAEEKQHADIVLELYKNPNAPSFTALIEKTAILRKSMG